MPLPSLTDVLSVLAVGTISAAAFAPQYPLILEKQRFKADIASVENLQKQYDVMKFETASDNFDPDNVWEALQDQGYIPQSSMTKDGFKTQTEGDIVFQEGKFVVDCSEIPSSEYTPKIINALKAEGLGEYLLHADHLE